MSSTPVDPNAANDTGTATLTSSIIADVSVTKTPSVPAAASGTAFTWTVTVVNNGPSTAVGASVTDAFPVPFTGVTWTCTASSGSTMRGTVRDRDDRRDGRSPRRRKRDVRGNRSQRAHQ